MGLDVWVIPGGRYVRAKMKDWSRRIPEIGKTFMALAEQYPADPSRPSIEYYRSQEELILHLPVLSLGRVMGQETVKRQKAPPNNSLERAPDTGRNHGFDAS